MKIINTTLKNDLLVITLDSAISIRKIYLDSVLNKKNMYSEKDDDHDIVVDSSIVQDNVIVVDITEYDATSFIVSVLTTGGDRDEAIAINQEELYLAKVNLLTTYCSTCLDKLQKHVIMMCDFKSQLLEYALENNLTQDAIEHYIDLSRLLGIYSQHNCGKCISPNRICSKCCNGICAL